MYPSGQLKALARHKAHVIQRSAFLRQEAVTAARGIEQSLSWVERAMDIWKRVGPLVKYGSVPLAFLARKFLFRKVRFLGPLIKWGPILLGLFRGFRSAQR